MKSTYLSSILKQLSYYKLLGERCLDQLTDKQLSDRIDAEGNSIAMIINHLSGNMLSRWTDFLNTDGEKPWRDREREFAMIEESKTALLKRWEEGWSCFITAIKSLSEQDLEKTVYIRNMGHSVTEAINRQIMHYSFHIGQIVFIGKTLLGAQWKSLSIPKGQSEAYNQDKFSQAKSLRHFTDDFLNHDDAST